MPPAIEPRREIRALEAVSLPEKLRGLVRCFSMAGRGTTLEATQWQIDGFFSQLPYKCYLEEVASVGDCLKICPWVTSRAEYGGARE